MRAKRKIRDARIPLSIPVDLDHRIGAVADTDWPAIVALYQQLSQMTRSPVIALNHAVAVAAADGPHTGLALIDQLTGLDGYHLYHAARAELLLRMGNNELAREAFTRAMTLTDNLAEQRHLARRTALCAPPANPSPER